MDTIYRLDLSPDQIKLIRNALGTVIVLNETPIRVSEKALKRIQVETDQCKRLQDQLYSIEALPIINASLIQQGG